MTAGFQTGQQATYLLFKLDDRTLALPADSVREIIWLPELTATPGMPTYVAGVFNLRGRLVPVIDLNLRAGFLPRPYELDHQVIVLEQAHGWAGLIAHEVRDVQSLGADQIVPLDAYQRRVSVEQRLGMGMVKMGAELAYVIDPALVTDPVWAADPVLDAAEALTQPARQFGSAAPPDKRRVWHERALALAPDAAPPEEVDQLSLAVIRLDSEIFGLDLSLVRGIAQVQAVTPIPCCPAHVLGNMNLRGDIVTLIDIRGTLSMPPAPAPTPGAPPKNSMTVMVERDEVRVGIVVDEVLDVINLPRSAVTEIPYITRSDVHNYTIGAAPYADRLLALLDLKWVLEDGLLIVDEEV